MAKRKFELGETFDGPSSAPRKFFPSVSVPAIVGEPGSSLSGTFQGRVTASRVDRDGKRSDIEMRSIDLGEQANRQRAVGRVAKMMRDKGMTR